MKKPEASPELQFVQEGMLITADIPVIVPTRVEIIVNRQRYIEESVALQKYPP